MRRPLIPRVDPTRVKTHRFNDYAMRFAFGAGITLVAGLVGMALGPKAGGVLLGFPAILPASLTLIQRTEGNDEASIDSISAVLGALAMVVFAAFVSLAARSLGAVGSTLIALSVWLVTAVALYFLVALVFEREPHPV